MKMTRLFYDKEAAIPTTRKGMQALVMSKLMERNETYLCDTVPESKFAIGEYIYGTMKALSEYIDRVHYVDDAEKLLLSRDFRSTSAVKVEDMCHYQLLRDASLVAGTAFRSACIVIGIRIWEALRQLSSIKTGDVLQGQYGTYEHQLVMTRIRIVGNKPSEIANAMGGDKRIFRPRVMDAGQVIWLKDHNLALFTFKKLNFKAAAQYC